MTGRIGDDGGRVREWAVAGEVGEPAPLHWMAVGRHRLTPALRRLAEALRGCCERLPPA